MVHTDGISYEFKPDRLKQINASPSGWVPPATGMYFLYSWSIARWNMRSSLRYASINSFPKSFKFPALGCPFYVKISLLGPQRRCLPIFIPIIYQEMLLGDFQGGKVVMTLISSFTQSVKVVTRSNLIRTLRLCVDVLIPTQGGFSPSKPLIGALLPPKHPLVCMSLQ